MSYSVAWYLENIIGVTFDEPLDYDTDDLYEFYGNA